MAASRKSHPWTHSDPRPRPRSRRPAAPRSRTQVSISAAGKCTLSTWRRWVRAAAGSAELDHSKGGIRRRGRRREVECTGCPCVPDEIACRAPDKVAPRSRRGLAPRRAEIAPRSRRDRAEIAHRPRRLLQAAIAAVHRCSHPPDYIMIIITSPHHMTHRCGVRCGHPPAAGSRRSERARLVLIIPKIRPRLHVALVQLAIDEDVIDPPAVVHVSVRVVGVDVIGDSGMWVLNVLMRMCPYVRIQPATA